MRARACARALLLAIALCLATTGGASAATTVSTASCPPSALNMTFTLLGTSVTQQDCRVSFGSTVGTSLLRVSQLDGAGVAMASASRGVLDTTFATGGTATIGAASARSFTDLVRQGDGSILAVGTAGTSTLVARFLADGSPDPAFDGPSGSGNGVVTIDVVPGVAEEATGLALHDDGRIVIVGNGDCATECRPFVATLGDDGSLDTSFAADGTLVLSDRIGSSFHATTIDALGRPLVAGCDRRPGGTCSALVGRLHGDGSWDSRFAADGWMTDDIHLDLADGSTTSTYRSIEAAANGDIHVAGDATGGTRASWAVAARFREDGSRYGTWGGGDGVAAMVGTTTTAETATTLAVDAEGRVVIAGSGLAAGRSIWVVQRFDALGVADATFGSGGTIEHAPGVGDGTVRSVATTSSGASYAVGAIDVDLGAAARGAVLALDEYGAIDRSFGTSGTATLAPVGTGHEQLASATIGADGAVIVAGTGRVGANDAARLTQLAGGTAFQQYGESGADFSGSGSTFGACLRSVESATAVWAGSSTCAAGDAGAWNAVPADGRAATSVVATSDATGTTSSASLRFGAHDGGDLQGGEHVAPLVIEVIAPDLVPPSSTTAPVLQGPARERASLTADDGTWSGSTPMSFSHAWERCTSAGTGCTPIANATGRTYLVGAADVGNRLRVVVTASNSEGDASRASAVSAIVTTWVPSITYNTGFEHDWYSPDGGDLFASTTPAQSIVSTVARNGTRSLQSIAGTTDSTLRPRAASVPATGTMVLRTYFRVDRLPNVNDVIVEAQNAAFTEFVELMVSPAGQLSLRSSTATVTGTVIEPGRWYRLDLRSVATANPWATNWAIDGIEQAPMSTARAATTWGTVGFGPDVASGLHVYFDDFAASQTSVDYPLPGSQGLLYTPNATATHSPTTPNAGSSTNNFGACGAIGAGDATSHALLADVPPLTGGTANGICMTGGGYLAYGLQDMAAATGDPTAVTVAAMVRDDNSGANEVSVTAAQGASTSQAFTANPTGVLGARAGTLTNAPAGGAWSRSAFDGLQLRIGSTDTVPQPRVDSLFAEVDHLAPATAMILVPPTVSGGSRVGGTLSATRGTWTDPTAAFSYQWLTCDTTGEACSFIAGATAQTYAPVIGNIGSRLRVLVTATTVGGRQTARSAATTAVGARGSGIVFLTGFEHATASVSGGGLFDVVAQAGGSTVPFTSTQLARSGSSALRTDSITGAATASYVRKTLPAMTTGVARISVLLGSIPTTRIEIIELDAASGDGCRVWFDPASGRFNARFDSGGAAAGTLSQQVVQAWRWYTLDIRCNVSANPRRMDMTVDGLAMSQTTSATAGTTLTSVSLGLVPGNASWTGQQWFDDLVVSNAGSDYPLSWGQVQAIRPDGVAAIATPANFRWTTAGSTTCATGTGYTAFVASDANTPRTRSDDVADWPIRPGAAATRWCQRAAGGSIDVTMEDPAEEQAPSAVSVIGAHASETAGTSTIDMQYGDTLAAGTWASAYGATFQPGTAMEYRSGARVLRANGAAWTRTALDALQLRIAATAVTTGAFTDALMAEYETPAGAPATPDTPPRIVQPATVPKPGDVLRVEPGTWTDASGPIERAWVWVSCDVVTDVCRPGAFTPTLTVPAFSVGKVYRVVEFGDDGDGAQGQMSAPTEIITADATSAIGISGFETGLVAATPFRNLGGTGATPVVSSAGARTGDFGLTIPSTGLARFVTMTTTGATNVLRGYVKVDAIPTGGGASRPHVFALRNSGNQDGGQVEMAIDGTMRLMTGYDFASTCTVVPGPTFVPNRWYLVDLRVTTADDSLTADWAVNGVRQTSSTCSDTRIDSTALSAAAVGPGGTQSGTWHFDDVVVTSTAGDFPIGGGRIHPLRPDADGTHDVPGRFSGDGGSVLEPAWPRFDDLVFGATTDFAQQDVADATAAVEVGVADPPDGAETARFVSATLQTRSLAGAGPNTFQWKALPGSTTEGTATTLFTGDVTGTSPVHRNSLVPRPGGGWTSAEVAGLRFRTGYASDVTPVPVVDALLAEAEYRE